MTTTLFSPIRYGSIKARNRFVMAPLTRCRADRAHLPNALMATYYGQRASAGLIVAECSMVMPNTSAFATEPGIYNDAQVQAWKQVTDAVHAKGGKIVLQIWHAGRAAHPAWNDDTVPVSSGSVALSGDKGTPDGSRQPHAVPHTLAEHEIPAIVEAFAQGAKNAMRAGFDGVEIHGANGYLIDQFLRDGCNQRSDGYGGSTPNRARLLFEVIEAVNAAIGSDKVGVRISPLNSANDMIDSDPAGLATYLAKELNRFGLAYLHLIRGDILQKQPGDVLAVVREHYQGVLISNMAYSAEEANAALAAGAADAVAFGKAFIANPDLPQRVEQNAALNAFDNTTFYTPGEKGYTDYPFLAAV
ncbi:MAG: alkene reductase [Brachymonas sp.]|nr:alkene reductase [Brachymonas sp.]